MGCRPFFLLGAALIAIAFAAQQPVVGQTTPTHAKADPRNILKPWGPPLAADGHVDLQGNWMNKSATPLERPKQLEAREFLTEEEVAELKKRAERIFKGGRSDFPVGDNAFLAALANPESYKSATATDDSTFIDRDFDNRTSLIIDPPDGKLPPYTPPGQRRRAEALSAALATRTPSGPRDLTASQRCITFGVPRVGTKEGAGEFGYYQIFQTANEVVLFMEALHEARIIPLDGRPHLPPAVRSWNGDARGRWEGGSLVVDTTNFSSSTDFLGAAEDLHLVERFTRIAPDEIRYEITVEAPGTWTRPWTAIVRLKRTGERLFEIACHEGNSRIMETMLSGTRAGSMPADESEQHK